MCDSKRCKKCNEVKPVTEFYAASKMKDGRMNICKVCHREDCNKRNTKRYKEDEEFRNKVLEYNKQPEAKAKASKRNKERYHNDPEFRQRVLDANRERNSEARKDPEYKSKVYAKSNKLNKERYHNDPEFRQRILESARRQYQRKKDTKAEVAEPAVEKKSLFKRILGL